MVHERRKYKRVEIFPMTVTLESQQKSFYGFITDLSESGLQICIHDDIENISDFSLKIPLPKEFDQDFLNIGADQVWINSLSNLAYNELGCKFKNPSPNQKESLKKLINLLESEIEADIEIPPTIDDDISAYI